MARDIFSPLAKWEIIDEIDNDTKYLEDELEVDSIKYHAPTTPQEDFARTGRRGGMSKKSF